MGKLLIALLLAVPLFAVDLTGRVVGPGGKPLQDAHVYVYTAQPKTGVGTICPSATSTAASRVARASKGMTLQWPSVQRGSTRA